jgi:hypothetical protein
MLTWFSLAACLQYLEFAKKQVEAAAGRPVAKSLFYMKQTIRWQPTYYKQLHLRFFRLFTSVGKSESPTGT